ncbi:hypothetical protein [Pseudomonas putida]|uniref:hypothetical protein n=1 Tax=Pseudomonas putida TaxID=303 RepID=UPI001A8FAD74|nr:hypothetical protein [Pseudomonas putida]
MIFSPPVYWPKKRCKVLSRIGLMACFALALSGQSSMASASSKGPTAEQVSQCFFIYGPILEVANKASNKSLKDYVLPRISWIWGFAQAKKGDAAFEVAFQKNITANKAAGMALEKRLRAAISVSRNNAEAASSAMMEALRPAGECDKYIGMSGKL